MGVSHSCSIFMRTRKEVPCLASVDTAGAGPAEPGLSRPHGSRTFLERVGPGGHPVKPSDRCASSLAAVFIDELAASLFILMAFSTKILALGFTIPSCRPSTIGPRPSAHAGDVRSEPPLMMEFWMPSRESRKGFRGRASNRGLSRRHPSVALACN